ncbi:MULTISPECIES: RNA polymerase sigma factor [Dysgonomonas]|uniref:Sigma-70 family RNA polymerase sigma factor n=1 Tax=Dysgonomonas capnocytophagoides TaxID=45254 RepID=A0A4Y8L0V2_9BACT|nr:MULTISPECIES: sigma-70 family RNA polymerase sigma factor [Dysgonomonas]MBS7119484.1 sigma-70 family RNA polymerase sigma factor [Dysgonomonas sp.]TFD96193.1 sigma-70 family RNA polymerase sigma factor [Dysgonomonas capnocytophagoides]
MEQILQNNMSAGLPESLNVSEVFTKYQAQLRGFISKRVVSKEDSEDILQNVFYQLSKVDPLVNPINQISGWLYAVTRNQIAEWGRRQKNEEMPTYSKNEENDFLTEVTEVLLADNASPETSYLRSMVWTELDTALEELPPLQREIFELTELQGFSFKEISESTGIPINTLLSRKRYAVLYLRDKLKNLYEDLLGE